MTKERNKFTRQTYRSVDATTFYTASQLVEAGLRDYLSEGRMESLDSEIKNVLESLSRMTQILYDRKLISRSDVYKIANERPV